MNKKSNDREASKHYKVGVGDVLAGACVAFLVPHAGRNRRNVAPLPPSPDNIAHSQIALSGTRIIFGVTRHVSAMRHADRPL